MNGLPASAAWRHKGAREGFEVVYIQQEHSSCRLCGHTAAVEGGKAWVVGYEIVVDGNWLTRTAHVWAQSPNDHKDVWLDTDGLGKWQVNGLAAPHLDGCLDIDLESSACTNTLPIHRLQLEVSGLAEAPAAYVRALDLAVERLDQTYVRVSDEQNRECYDYAAPAFNFSCHLVYDDAGLIVDYPGIASRAL